MVHLTGPTKERTNGHVVGLDISSQSISGGIDNSNSLFDLQQLQSLNLANNVFSYGSHIPSAIGKLTNLRYLNLSNSYNYGEGKIPVEISQLLYLDGVNISAPGKEWCQAISSSLPDLRVLSLSNTLLSGPVDQSLAKLQSLSVIKLDNNYGISGPIPRFFANFSNLREFSWDGNNVSAPFLCNEELLGSLPEFPNNGSLRSLVLPSTNFSGLLPGSIGNLKHLERLNFSTTVSLDHFQNQ
ncbi:receptor-like protein 7 [Malus domestica]|uniref:receptor-like protein 7 n=1 Tax=Malus domestica TaxID=3750 RepID=UPI003974E46D